MGKDKTTFGVKRCGGATGSDVSHVTKTINHWQATGKLYHLRLRVKCTLFLNHKAWGEPTPHWW